MWVCGKMAPLSANFTTSYRAPALEELYNNGPHPGNLAFEIGDENLERERSNGVDLSLRHQNSRIRAEANFFYYDIRNFVFLNPTGDVQDDLNVFNYAQADSRFVGTEARVRCRAASKPLAESGDGFGGCEDQGNGHATAENSSSPRACRSGVPMERTEREARGSDGARPGQTCRRLKRALPAIRSSI